MRTGRRHDYDRSDSGTHLYSDKVREALGPSRHFTVLYTTFVFMQLFNQINCRKLTREMNIFSGFFGNRIALAVIGAETGLQVALTEFGRDVFALSYRARFRLVHTLVGTDRDAVADLSRLLVGHLACKSDAEVRRSRGGQGQSGAGTAGRDLVAERQTEGRIGGTDRGGL